MRACIIGDGLQLIGDDDAVPEGGHIAPLHASAADTPPRDLVYDGAVVRARSTLAVWHIDGLGNWHGTPAPDRQPLAAAWGTVIVKDGEAWRAKTPAETLAPRIAAECARRIEAACGGRRPSILSYAIALNGRVSIGLASGQSIAQSLTAEEHADVQLIWALDAWEGAMIEVREALIAAGDASYADAAHWPAAPAGVTAAWLTGF